MDDAAGNTLKSTSTTAFTTEGADVNAPSVTKVYKGVKLEADKEVTTATNVVKTDSFTFLFDEAIKDSTDIDTTKVKVEVYNPATSSWGTPAGFTAATDVKTTAVVTDKDSKKVGLTVALSTVTAMDDAKYRIVIGAGAVQDAQGNKNTQEKVFEFIGTVGDDAVASVEVKTGSVNGSNAFTSSDAVDKNIYVTFDENEIFEVASSSVKVTDKDGNAIAGTLKEIDQPTGLTAFSATNKVYVFNPDADLNSDAIYTVTVEGVKDIAGNTIAKKVVQFKTATGAVKVAETSVVDKAQAVDRQKTITAKLTKERALAVGTAGSLTDGQISLTTKALPNSNVTGLAVTSKNNIDYTINFNELTADTQYVLTIKVEGETKTINFTTGVVSTDVVKPKLSTVGTVSGTTFTGGTGNPYVLTSATDDLAVQFSEAVKLADDAKVIITEVSENKEVAVLSKSVVDVVDGNTGADTLTINPVLDLATSKTYKLSVTGVKDAAGNVADDIVVYVVAP